VGLLNGSTAPDCLSAWVRPKFGTAALINTRHFFGTHPSAALSHFRDQQNYGIIQENVNIHVKIITFMIIWTDYLQYRAKLRGFDDHQSFDGTVF
jgi:hypothetical protein